MRKSLIAKVVTGALVSVLVSACTTENNASSVNSADDKPNKASEIWPALNIEVKSDPAVESKVSDILFCWDLPMSSFGLPMNTLLLRKVQKQHL